MRRFSFYNIIMAGCLVVASSQAQAAGHGATPVSSADQNEARDRYKRGLSLIDEGKYDVALIEMKRAYDLNPSYRILYNLGQIQTHLGDYASALTHFERYLSEGGSEIPLPRVTEVNQEIAKIRTRVGSVDLTVQEDGAEVLLDDISIGRAPFHRKVYVNSGSHRFTASKTGVSPVSRILQVAGNDNLSLTLEITTASPVQPSPTVSPIYTAYPTPVAKSKNVPWTAWGITAALAAGAVTTGIVTFTDAKNLKDMRDSPNTSRQALDDKESTTKTMAVVSDILTGATLVAGGIALYYTVRSGSSSEAPTRAAVQNVRLQVQPQGVYLRGTF